MEVSSALLEAMREKIAVSFSFLLKVPSVLGHVYVCVWRPNRAIISGQTRAEGECVQRKKRYYLNSPGGFKVHPGFVLLYPDRAAELKRHALCFTYNVLV